MTFTELSSLNFAINKWKVLLKRVLIINNLNIGIMKHLKFCAIAVLSCIILFACSGKEHNTNKNSSDKLSGELSISGAFALYPLVVVWAGEFQELHPNVKIDISAGGAGKGITDALSGMVDLGMVSRELHREEINKGAIGIAVAKDAVVVTINAKNPKLKEVLSHGITAEIAKKIWISGKAKNWGDVLGTNDKTPLHVYTRSDACGAAETFANWFGYRQEDLLGTAVYADPGLAAVVQKDIYGIGFNNIGYAYDNETHKYLENIRIMPIDANTDGKISKDEFFYNSRKQLTKAIANGKYPSPPARDLYLVSKGVPKNPVVIEFLRYILTKGQEKNESAGYIKMNGEKIQKGLKTLGIG